jgi:pyruvate-formate lyase
MLSEENVKAAGPNCAKLHAYVMEHSNDKLAFPAMVDQEYFKGGCLALMLNNKFSSMYNLITMLLWMLP